MTIDRVTETITHFIGAFELAEETGRLRADYDSFRAARLEEEDPEALVFEGLRPSQSHALKGVDPSVKHQPLPPPNLAIEAVLKPGPETPAPPVELATKQMPLPTQTLTTSASIGYSTSSNATQPSGLDMPPPSSVASISYMSNWLEDADTFGLTTPELTTHAAQTVASISEALETLAEQAASLSPLGPPPANLTNQGEGSPDWHVLAEEMLEAAAQIDTTSEAVTVLQGSKAQGFHVDGGVVETLPDWQALRPEYLRRDDEEEGGDPEAGSDHEAGSSDLASSGETISTGAVSQDKDAPGFAERMAEALRGPGETPVAPRDETFGADDPVHQLVTGGNIAINEVAISSKWLDAPYIVVEGTARNLDAVSQVNVLFDRDSGMAGGAGSAAGESSPSLAINAAEIVTTQNAATPASEWSGGPAQWAIARIAGDLVQVNSIQQYNFINDSDHARVDFSASRTHLGQGDNLLINTAVMNQFGFHFDLIFVGGDMIDMNVVRQMNLLVDDDVVGPVGGPVAVAGAATETVEDTAGQGGAVSAPELIGTVEDGTASHSKDIIVNAKDGTSPATPSGPAAKSAGGAEAMDTTQAAGPAPASPPASAPAPTPVSAPSKAVAKDTGPKEPAAKAAEASPAETASAATTPPAPQFEKNPDNLLYNEAQIHTVGRDVAAEIPEALSNAGAAFAKGAEHLQQEVMDLDLFDGVDLLKVLLIEGNFTTINWIDQINVMGDSDQVELLHAALAAQHGAEIVTDANMLANLVAIRDNGVDSEIMAKNGFFDDAMLHQVGLLDDSAPPEGVGLAALASEAVAFLADDMLAAADMAVAEAEALAAAADAGIAATQASQADVMQTMLS